MPKFTAPVPDEENAFIELADIIATLPRFSLLFAICADDKVAELHIAHFIRLYPGNSVSRVHLHFPNGRIYELLEEEYEANKPDAIFITGMEAWVERDENSKGNEFTTALNNGRDHLHDHVHCPVVFWCTPVAYNFIRRNAHDFYSVSSSTLYVSLPSAGAGVSPIHLGIPNLDAIRSLSVAERHLRIEALKKWLKDNTMLSSPEHYKDKIRVLHYIGSLLLQESKYDDARSCLNQARELAQLQGDNYPYLGDLIETTALTYLLKGAYHKAKILIRQAQAVTMLRQGLKSPEYATHLTNLAQIEDCLGNFDNSISLYKQAISIFEATTGKNYPDTAFAISGMATVEVKKGNYVKAKQLYEESLDIIEKIFGRNFPTTAAILQNLAGIEQRLGNFGGAKAMYEEALKIFENTIGTEQAQFANTLSNLSFLEYRVGRRDVAKILLERALLISNHTVGKSHPNTKSMSEALNLVSKSVQKLPENALLNTMIVSRPRQYDHMFNRKEQSESI